MVHRNPGVLALQNQVIELAHSDLLCGFYSPGNINFANVFQWEIDLLYYFNNEANLKICQMIIPKPIKLSY